MLKCNGKVSDHLALMAKKKNPILGCLLLIMLAIGAGIQLFKYNPAAGIAGVLGIVFVGGVLLYAMRRKRCEVCGNFLERKKFFWDIDGEKKRVCSHCNQTFMRRQSRAATRNIR
jgi:hypothetical protein